MFRSSHEWRAGAALPALVAGAVVVSCALATCVHCETLRVRDAAGDVFIRRAACACPPLGCVAGCPRILSEEPQCLAPSSLTRLRVIDVWPLGVASVKASDAILLPREPAHGRSPAPTTAQQKLPW